MPLNEQEVQEITTALESGKSLAEITALGGLSKVEGLVLRTKSQNETYETAFEKRIETEKIAPRVSELYHQIDKDIEEITGKKRPQDQKTYEHNKNVLKELMTKSTIDESEEIKKLKKQLESKGEISKEEFEALNKKWAEEKAARESEGAQYRMNLVTRDKQRIIDQHYLEISKKFKSDLPSFFQAYRKEVENKLMSKSKLSEDGQSLILLDDSGNTAYGPDHNPLKLSTYLEMEFKDVIQTGAGNSGTGVGQNNNNQNNQQQNNNNGTGGAETKPWEGITVPTTIRSSVELRKWMIDNKYNESLTKVDFTRVLNHFSDTMKLPLQ